MPKEDTNGAGASGVLLLTVSVALLFAGAFLLWSLDTRSGGLQPEYSVRRTDDRGAAVLFRLYERAGLQPQIWDRELTGLSEPGMLVMIAPAGAVRVFGVIDAGTRGDVLPHEVEALDRWVRSGGVAVLLARDTNPVYEGVGLIVDEPTQTGAGVSVPVQAGPLADRVEAIETRASFGFKYGRTKSDAAKALEAQKVKVEEAPSPIAAIPAEEWLPLFVKKDAGRDVSQVVAAARGKGLYVAVNDAWIASNLGVTFRDNARFLLNLAALRPRGGPVFFDEYHKRNVQRNLMGYVRDRGLLPVLVYGVILLAAVYWRSGVRFGPAVPLRDERHRSSAEYLQAAAALYSGAGMGREALQHIMEDFRRRVAGSLRLHGRWTDEELGQRYQERTGRSGQEAREAYRTAVALLTQERVPVADALAACKKLHQVDEALRAQGEKERTKA